MIRHSIFSAIVLLLVSCSHRYLRYAAATAMPSEYGAPVYASLNYWSAHPQTKDPSDSVPPVFEGEIRDTIADLFFIHPTTYTGAKDAGGENADLSDAELNAKTDRTTILYQASAFNQHARIFAPRYRQAHISNFFKPDLSAVAAFDTAYADVKAAFQYYLANEWNRRPIIIASHSQGSFLAKRLLAEFFENKPLQRYLVVAYLAGWPVFKTDFSGIPACKDSTETGCYCSWRTFREGYVPDYVEKEPAVSVTNPLNWRTDSTPAAASLQENAVLRDFKKSYNGILSARVHKNVLWVPRPHFPGSFLYRTPNYHIGDINLFYGNIRANLDTRLQYFIRGFQVN